MSLLCHSMGNTPLVPILKLLQPHKISPSSCEIHAKCEFRNPSGSMWDRLVCHEMKKNLGKSTTYVTGGISDLCLSLAWAGLTSTSGDISVAVFPGVNMGDFKRQLLQGLGANVILSYQQDSDRVSTKKCLEHHMNKLEATSGVNYHKILPFGQLGLQERSSSENQGPLIGDPYDCLIQEVNLDEHKWNTIVCSGQDKRLIEKLRIELPQTVDIVSVDFSGNTFTETFSDVQVDVDGVKYVQVSDAECYDMARRLVREEGLMVGPISGGVMAAAMKEIKSTAAEGSLQKIMAIFPDSLQNNSRDFLSVDWMVQKGYYPLEHLESMFWWYEMAVENINPPEVLMVTPETPIKLVCAAMNTSSMERCVVIQAEDKRIVGVVCKECVAAQCNDDLPVGDVCTKQFGLVDSKANFSELERLLRKYNWIINVHRVPMYTRHSATGGPSVNRGLNMPNTNNQLYMQMSEEVIGAINMADFIRYKRKIEKHHMKEYGISMSDGIPSDIWLEKFGEHLQNKQKKNLVKM